jgi:putative transposase
MTEYRRYFIPGGTYFFTVNLADRTKHLLIDHIDLLLYSIESIRKEPAFTIDAITVLPDHLHTVWTLPQGDKDFSARWRKIKARFSRGLPNIEQRSISRHNKGERGIWQRRFWEHAIRDELDFQRHVDYVHYNPVKHGYCRRVMDWPYSSFHRHVHLGIYPLDWAGDGNNETVGFGK